MPLADAALALWRRLPAGVRASRPAAVARRAVAGWSNGARPGGEPPIVVRTLEQLDEMLAMLDQAAAVSDDALRAGFDRFVMELDLDYPPDPFSDEYRQRVFELYRWLHGRDYHPSHEGTDFDLEAALRAPFPYSTRSAKTVGEHLIAIGHLIRSLDLPPGSRVLELGSGWGNTAVALAQTGFKVTAVDIEPKFVTLLEERASQVQAEVEAIVGDFSAIDTLERRFDAVVFFECFHHAADHLRVLSGLDRVVEPGGRVVFAGEPIGAFMPVPWGLRLDGQSLWAIRKHGWLELGFQEPYFHDALGRHGWVAEPARLGDATSGLVYVARRASESPP